MLQANFIIIALLILLSAPLARGAEPAYDISAHSETVKERTIARHEFAGMGYTSVLDRKVTIATYSNPSYTKLFAPSFPMETMCGTIGRYNSILFRQHLYDLEAGNSWIGNSTTFSYLLPSYAGTALYLDARRNGLNGWSSLLYNVAMSTFLTRYGSNNTKDNPSVRKMILTPVVGAMVGECFYRVKHNIASRRYEVLGSPVLGYIAAFFMDPVNEVSGYFRKEQYQVSYNPEKQQKEDDNALSSCFWVNPGGLNPGGGIRITYHF